MKGDRGRFCALAFAFGLALTRKLLVGLSVVVSSHRAVYEDGHLVADRIARPRGTHNDIGSVGSSASAIFGHAEAQAIAGAVNLEEIVRSSDRSAGTGTGTGERIGLVNGEDQIGKVIRDVGAAGRYSEGGMGRGQLWGRYQGCEYSIGEY